MRHETESIIPLSLLSFTVTPSSHAINVGDVTSIMGPDASTLAKEIINTTDTARYGLASAWSVSHRLWPVARLSRWRTDRNYYQHPPAWILPGNAKERLSFFYKGPQDNQERYYRISWTDEPVTEFEASKKKKQGEATTSAIIGTILVVAPREERFDYRRDNRHGNQYW